MRRLILKKNEEKGHLITFCGLDGSGKTSMIRWLAEQLRQTGREPYLTKQPTSAVRKSGIFRNYMDEDNHSSYEYRALSLMAASDRIQHTNKVIVPELEQGMVVVSDRYFYSCLANLRARGYTEDQWIYEIGSYMIEPDVSFFLDIPVEQAVERVRQRPEEQERYIDMELQYRLRDEYLAIADDVGGIVISSILPKEECFEQIKRAVEKKTGIALAGKQTEGVEEAVYRILEKYAAAGGRLEEGMDLELDLGMDSLNRTQLICDIEEQFHFEFQVEDLAPDKFRKVGDVCRMAAGYMRARA
ncbi:MAG: dTMP kinase [Lachnospiraceae bacterium]|nr:dTMP kinase [Lachnospiraceae bacterium]